MKQLRLLILLALTTVTNAAIAQVGIGTTTPDATAQLDLSSTTKGFLPPRMTLAQRDAITVLPAKPAKGLIIFCTNCGTGEWEGYNGYAWTNISGAAAQPVLAVGMSFQGGIIGYILQPADLGYVAGESHGLIVASTDQSTVAQFGCAGNISFFSSAIGYGNSNTNGQVAACTTAGIAARLCYDLALNGYSDWYLPSSEELRMMAINQANVGAGFTTTNYWSSTCSGPLGSPASAVSFNTNTTISQARNALLSVRAVRSF